MARVRMFEVVVVRTETMRVEAAAEGGMTDGERARELVLEGFGEIIKAEADVTRCRPVGGHGAYGCADKRAVQ